MSPKVMTSQKNILKCSKKFFDVYIFYCQCNIVISDILVCCKTSSLNKKIITNVVLITNVGLIQPTPD